MIINQIHNYAKAFGRTACSVGHSFQLSKLSVGHYTPTTSRSVRSIKSSFMVIIFIVRRTRAQPANRRADICKVVPFFLSASFLDDGAMFGTCDFITLFPRLCLTTTMGGLLCVYSIPFRFPKYKNRTSTWPQRKYEFPHPARSFAALFSLSPLFSFLHIRTCRRPSFYRIVTEVWFSDLSSLDLPWTSLLCT